MRIAALQRIDSKSKKQLVALAVLIVLGLLVIAALVPSSPRRGRSPYLAEMNRVRHISRALAYCAEEHPAEIIGKSIEWFVATGAISTHDVQYMKDHQIIFYGFGTNQNGPGPIVEGIYSNRHLQRRIVGYSDGTLQVSTLEGRQ